MSTPGTPSTPRSTAEEQFVHVIPSTRNSARLGGTLSTAAVAVATAVAAAVAAAVAVLGTTIIGGAAFMLHAYVLNGRNKARMQEAIRAVPQTSDIGSV